MAEAGLRIPAWKRLGLALKNEVQSGVTAPDPATSKSPLHHLPPHDRLTGSRDHVHSPLEPALNSETSKLGKRKHQHDAAEDDGQTAKKGRTSATPLETYETPAPAVPIIADVESSHVPAAAVEPPPAPSQPKGDPNYRQKKERPKKPKRRNHEDKRVQPAPAPALAPAQLEVNGGRSALSPDAVVGQPTLLASTEIHEQALARALTPQAQREANSSSNKDKSGSPAGIDRRKSVTFTPDTKRVDGSSAQDLFKKWVADSKETASFDYETGEFTIPESVLRQEAEDIEEAKKAAKAAKETKEKQEKSIKAPAAGTSQKDILKPTTPNTQDNSLPSTPAKGKKKDPSIYVSYLNQYHADRQHWKFNKAKQNDVVDNALNVFRIPEQHSEALLEYVQGLKGAGVIERLKERCKATLRDLEEEGAKDTDISMDDATARQAAHDEALKARVAKEQKRRKVEGDIESLAQHPHGDGFIRRLRRERAMALLTALGRTAPILPATQTNGVNPLLQTVAPKRDSKKRKRRVEVSSDESSSESSSDDSSSSDSDSEDDSGSDVESKSSSSDASASSDGNDSSDSKAASSNRSRGGHQSESGKSSDSGSDSDSD